MVEAYWEIGRQIVEATGERAEYGKGFTQRNLYQMQQFYLAFPKVHALRAQLSWTHYRRLMRIPNQKQREFYMNAAADEHWTSRQLDHQIATFYREPLLSSQGEKHELIRTEIQRSEPAAADDFIKDSYVLEIDGESFFSLAVSGAPGYLTQDCRAHFVRL